jgi:hypothetical protein
LSISVATQHRQRHAEARALHSAPAPIVEEDHHAIAGETLERAFVSRINLPISA